MGGSEKREEGEGERGMVGEEREGGTEGGGMGGEGRREVRERSRALWLRPFEKSNTLKAIVRKKAKLKHVFLCRHTHIYMYMHAIHVV